MVWQSMVGCGMVPCAWHGMGMASWVWYDVWYDVVWCPGYGVVWCPGYGMMSWVWHGMVWYDVLAMV